MVSSDDCRPRGRGIESHKERKLKLEKEELRAGAMKGGGGNFVGGGGNFVGGGWFDGEEGKSWEYCFETKKIESKILF